MSSCPKCGSERIIPCARVIDHEDGYEIDLNVEVYEHPAARIDADRRGRYGITRANVCAGCGFAEFFIVGHEELWKAYERSRSEG